MHLHNMSKQSCCDSLVLNYSLYTHHRLSRVMCLSVCQHIQKVKTPQCQEQGSPFCMECCGVNRAWQSHCKSSVFSLILSYRSQCVCKGLWTIYFCHFVVNARLILWRAIHPSVVNIIHAYFQYDTGQITKDKWYSTRTWLSKCSYQGIHMSASNLSCSECFIWLDLLCLIYIPASHRANGP